MSVFKFRGVDSEIEVFEDQLTLTPKGMMGFMTKGLKGTKTIPFSSITAVQYKKAGLTSGYLQFSMLGGNESRGGVFSAGADENSFMYAHKKDNGLVEEIKGYIEAHIGQKSVPQAKRNDLAGQLAKLAQLRVDGVLSEEEFAQAKQRALSDD